MAEIEGDPHPVEDQLVAIAKDATEPLVGEWRERSENILLRRGRELDYEVWPVLQSGTARYWLEEEQAWAFHFSHFAAVIFEFGTDPHPIRAREADWLAFEWPQMAGEPFGDTGMTFDQVFESTWPTVFFKEVMHPGTEALRFVQDAWRETSRGA